MTENPGLGFSWDRDDSQDIFDYDSLSPEVEKFDLDSLADHNTGTSWREAVQDSGEGSWNAAPPSPTGRASRKGMQNAKNVRTQSGKR